MKGDSAQYLLDYKHGKIKKGYSIGCDLDNHLRFKRKQLNIILGHDNVGKTYWINWYFLTLAVKHELRFCIWSGENQKGQILRDMIQMYVGQKFTEIEDSKILSTATFLEQYFDFIPNDKLYKPTELLKLFEESECDAALIDPFTGLDRSMTFEGNYNFLNEARQFVNKTGVTIYINTHPNSESGRSGNLYGENHMWKGHLKPPLKDHVEGGKAFLNRCDDMFVIHRLIKHESMKYYTMVNVEKIKDLDTGGMHTRLDEPILCEFNNGLGFKINSVDPIRNTKPISNSFPAKQLPLNKPDIVNGKELLSFSEKWNQAKDPF